MGDEEETTARLLGFFPEDGSSGIMPATKPRPFLRGGVFLAAGFSLVPFALFVISSSSKAQRAF